MSADCAEVESLKQKAVAPFEENPPNRQRFDKLVNIAKNLYLTSNSHYKQENWSEAFFFSYRLTILLVEHLRSHASFNSAEFSKDKAWVDGTSLPALEQAEALKKRLNALSSIAVPSTFVEGATRQADISGTLPPSFARTASESSAAPPLSYSSIASLAPRSSSFPTYDPTPSAPAALPSHPLGSSSSYPSAPPYYGEGGFGKAGGSSNSSTSTYGGGVGVGVGGGAAQKMSYAAPAALLASPRGFEATNVPSYSNSMAAAAVGGGGLSAPSSAGNSQRYPPPAYGSFSATTSTGPSAPPSLPYSNIVSSASMLAPAMQSSSVSSSSSSSFSSSSKLPSSTSSSQQAASPFSSISSMPLPPGTSAYSVLSTILASQEPSAYATPSLGGTSRGGWSPSQASPPPLSYSSVGGGASSYTQFPAAAGAGMRSSGNSSSSTYPSVSGAYAAPAQSRVGGSGGASGGSSGSGSGVSFQHSYAPPPTSSLLSPSSTYSSTAYAGYYATPTIAPSAAASRGGYPQGGTGGKPRSAFAPQLRRVQIPSSIIALFSGIAEPNNRIAPRGIETCGVLAGSASSSCLTITHLILPSQHAGPDSCEMLDEDLLLSYCLDQGLVMLGWIHTHPSQNCFMSSMDTHTHCSFQATLPEALAIVVAPMDAAMPYSVFRLTDDPQYGSGLEVILACDLRGFHPHDAPFPIFESSSHVEWAATSLQVKDLRKPK